MRQLLNLRGKEIKAVKIYWNHNTGLPTMDIVDSDAVVYEGIEYNAESIEALYKLIDVHTVVEDTRSTFDNVLARTKQTRAKMYSKFKELCDEYEVEFERVKKVLDAGNKVDSAVNYEKAENVAENKEEENRDEHEDRAENSCEDDDYPHSLSDIIDEILYSIGHQREQSLKKYEDQFIKTLNDYFKDR